MIWLNKLIKDVDSFYSLAINSTSDLISIAETEEEKKARLREKARQKMLERAKTEKGPVIDLTDAEKQKQKAEEDAKAALVARRKAVQTAGRAALNKVNSWEFINEDLYNAYQAFMQTYVEIFTRIQKIDPDVIGDVLESASGQLEDEKELDDLDSQTENIKELADTLTNALPQRLTALARLPYLTQSKDIEDADSEADDAWVEEFSSEEFISAINDMAEDCQVSAEIALGDDISVAEAAMTAMTADIDRRTNQEGEGLGQAFEAGLTPTGDKKEQVLAAIRRHRANAAAAWKANKGPDDPLWNSAFKAKKTRAKYEAAIKADPKRLANKVSKAKKRSATYNQRMRERLEIIAEWNAATTQQEKDYVKRKAKAFFDKLIYSRGLHSENLREREVMLTSRDLVKEIIDYVQGVKEKDKQYKATRQAKIRGMVGYDKMLNKLKNQLADLKKNEKVKIKDEGINLEHTFFNVPREALKKATADVLRGQAEGYPALTMARLNMALEIAKQNLAKAMLDWKEQEKSVSAVAEQTKPLQQFREEVKALLQKKLISNEFVALDPAQEAILRDKVALLSGLLNQYPVANAAAANCRAILDQIISDLSKEEPVIEPAEEQVAQPDLTETFKEASMNIKARTNILKRIQKDAEVKSAISKTSQVQAAPPGVTNYDQLAEEYTSKVFRELAEQLWGEESFSADDQPSDDED